MNSNRYMFFCFAGIILLAFPYYVGCANSVYLDSITTQLDTISIENVNTESFEIQPFAKNNNTLINFVINSTYCNNNGTPCDPSDDLICVNFTIYETGVFGLGWKDCITTGDVNIINYSLTSGQSYTICLSINTAIATNCTGGTEALFWIGRRFGDYNADDVFVTIPATCSNGSGPNPPNVTPGSGCVNQNITLSASCSSSTPQWYTSSSGGTAFHAGNSYTSSYSSSGTYTYYVSCKNTTTGCESSRVPVSATVNDLPSAPSTSDAYRCGTGIVTLTANGCGGTLRWYNAPSGGSQVATGTSYSPSLSSTTTYYVECFLNGCASSRTPVTAYIYTNPSTPSVTNGSGCVGQNITLSANCSSNTAQWYYSSSGGSAFHTGSSYTDYYSSSGTYTYYVSCYNVSTGCESSRVAVSATVYATPSAPNTTDGSRCGTGVVNLYASGCSGGTLRWYNAPSGGSQVATGTSYSPSLSSTTTYYVECFLNGCTSSRTPVTAYIYTNPSTPSVTNGSGCVGQNITLSANCSSNTAQWYYSSSGGSAFHTGNSYTDYYSSSGTYTYYVSCYNVSTGCESSRVAVSATVYAIPSAPTSVSGSRCGTGTVTLGASGCSGGTLNWYATASGGTSLGIGTSFTTSSISTTTTYYVECTINGCTSARTAVTATVNSLPVATASGSTVCVGGTITLTSGGGTSYAWSGPNSYSNNTQNPSISSATLAMAGTYTVTVTNASTCTATATATVSVVNDPTLNVTGGDVTVCVGASNITLTANTSGGTGTFTYLWQSSPDNSTWTTISGATSSTYIITASSTSNLYYRVSVTQTGSGCNVNPSTGVRVVVVADPTVSITATSPTICYNTSTTINATISGGTGTCTYSWESSPNGSTGWAVIGGATSSSYNTGNLTATTYYRVTYNCTVIGCNSASSNVVTVTVNPNITINAGSDVTICRGSSTVLNPTVTGGTSPYTYLWTPASFLSGINIATPTATPTITTTYTLSITDTRGCTGATDQVIVNVIVPVTAGTGTNPSPICKANTGLSTINLFNQLTGESSGGTWTVISGTPGANFTAATGILNPNGLMMGTYVFRYSVTGTAPCPNDTEDVSVIINFCCPPIICLQGPSFMKN